MDISTIRVLLDERIKLSIKQVLTNEDKVRLKELANIEIPKTESYRYGNFTVYFYPLQEQYLATCNSVCIRANSKEELYSKIATMSQISFEEWEEEYGEEACIAAAESGRDREGCFNLSDYLEKKYNEFVEMPG